MYNSVNQGQQYSMDVKQGRSGDMLGNLEAIEMSFYRNMRISRTDEVWIIE